MSASDRHLGTILTLLQLAAALWLVLWGGILLYHLWVAGYFASRADNSDSYFVVVHFDPALGGSFYAAMGLFFGATFMKWWRRKGG